jgi:Sec-independent protein translocase protein TatA
MKNYMEEFETHLNKITEGVLNENVEEGMELSNTQRKLANYGRILMDQAVTQKDDNLSNVMAKVGNELTNFGATFGPKSLEELVKKTGTAPNIIKKLLAYAENISKTQASLSADNSDGGLDDEGDDEFTSAADDEMDAIQADRAARDASR